EPRRPAGAPGEDAGERLDGVDRRALVDEQAGRPVAARQRPRNVGDQADLGAGEVDVIEIAVVDADAGPGLAIAFGRLMLAKRQHARAEHCAIAREHQLAVDLPGFRQDPLLLRIARQPDRAGQLAAIEEMIMAAPTARNTAPTARPNRVVLDSFSIVIRAPSAAIQITFMAPTANITSIIAQQQPAQ